MLIGQNPSSYKGLDPAGTGEAAGPFSDLECLENDIDNILKVPRTYLARGSRGLSSEGCDQQGLSLPGAKTKGLQLAGVSFQSLRAQLNCGDLRDTGLICLLWGHIVL